MRSPTCPFRSEKARRSVWWASRGAARPPSGASSSSSSGAVSGSITFKGDELATMHSRELRRYRRNLQLMFQDAYASLDPRMRVATILREPLKVQKMGQRRRAAPSASRLADGRGRTQPVSGGALCPRVLGRQRQRIGLAHALALRPPADRGRRTGVRPRCVHPSPDPQLDV